MEVAMTRFQLKDKGIDVCRLPALLGDGHGRRIRLHDRPSLPEYAPLILCLADDWIGYLVDQAIIIYDLEFVNRRDRELVENIRKIAD